MTTFSHIETLPLKELVTKLNRENVDEEFYPRTYGLHTKDSIHLFPQNTTWYDNARFFANIYKETDEPIMMVDLSVLYFKWQEWYRLMPNVTPHYAVKSNDLTEVVAFLSALGVNFDCASKAEIDKVMELPGITGEHIIYGNPCKSKTHLLHAKKMNVKKMTFDCEAELQKIKLLFPEAELILRLKVDDSGASSQLGKKFGAAFDECPELLRVVKDLDLNLVGVSFHVGSGQKNANAHVEALQLTKKLFQMAEEQYDLNMNFLDIGGGFPGYDDDKAYIRFERIATGITEALEELFPDCTIVAEPGRYFACACCCLLTKITTKKAIKTAEGNPCFKYYINDGVYGAFNNVLNDSAVPVPSFLNKKYLAEDIEQFPSVVYGPTCDSLDTILPNVSMPELQLDDFIYWENMGAYTVCVSSTFNGFPLASLVYTWTGEIEEGETN